MGYCPAPTPEMGEYSVEVRSESFYLRGEDTSQGERRHSFYLYAHRLAPQGCGMQGTVEILIGDIPKLRAALDQVERIEAGNPNKE